MDYFSTKNYEQRIPNGIYYSSENALNIFHAQQYNCRICEHDENNGINLAEKNLEFINKLEFLKSQAARINPHFEPIELLIDYTPLCIQLESIELKKDIASIKLIGIYNKPPNMKEEIFNAQKLQTYWGYKQIAQMEEFDFREVRIKDITLFQEGGKDYMGENLEIDLIKYNWQHYDKQIVVFGFSDTSINANGEKILKNAKWRIITWHNPIINPRITLFSFSGKFNPNIAMFGRIDGRKTEKNKKGTHKALDFFAQIGTKIYAPLDCEVIDINFSSSYGQTITLKITGFDLNILKIRRAFFNYQLAYQGEMINGEDFNEEAESYYLFYAHLSKVNVAKGDKLFAGQIIGLSGTSGSACGTKAPHLHFEIRSENKTISKSLKYLVNPAFYIECKKLYNEFSQEEKQEQQRMCGKACKLP